MGKMWAGRFEKALDSTADDFNSSIHFDCRMFREDIAGSTAHAKMLGECGIITREESAAIVSGLSGILADIESGALPIDYSCEDIHMFIEEELTKRLGIVGKKLHTGRSRNDQVALDVRLYLRNEGSEVISLVKGLIAVIAARADEHKDTVMPGYTHLQRAQPITFGHHLLAYAFMLIRDCGRIKDALSRMNCSPLGCAALAGTTYNIDREMTSSLLGFDGVCENSLDGVSDRDFALELLSAISILMMHLSRSSEEIILWSSWEFKFIELSDAYSTGSSIMPQKKNPDMAELVRGKTGRVYGDLFTLLTALKGLPLAYNKDMQEDKEALFDALDTVKMCLSVFTPMLDSMSVYKENMRLAAGKGFINATDCADYLVSKGLPFREAYKIVGGIVGECTHSGETLETLPLESYKKYSPAFEGDVYEAIRLDSCVAKRMSRGGTAPASVAKQIDIINDFLKGDEQ